MHHACLSFVENRFVYNLSFACNNFAKFDSSVWNRRNHLILECRSYRVAVMICEIAIRSNFGWKHYELTKLMISLSLSIFRYVRWLFDGCDCQYLEWMNFGWSSKIVLHITGLRPSNDYFGRFWPSRYLSQNHFQPIALSEHTMNND